MNKNFMEAVKVSAPNRNVFDLSHDVKFSGNMGELIPTLVMECVPGDKFQIGTDSLIRFAPLTAPVMHRFDFTQHYFFVPKRLLWDNYENWITQTPVAGNLPAHPFMAIEDGDVIAGGLWNYLGLPINNVNTLQVSPMAMAAYNFIWNEYYRDQNLQQELVYKLLDGDNTVNVYTNMIQLQNRAWEKDYFTSALPTPQKGAAIDIPLGTIDSDAVVQYNSPIVPSPITLTGAPTNIDVAVDQSTTAPINNLYANTDGLQLEPVTINSLRIAVRMQEFFEKLMRGGSRYFEFVRNIFGTKSPDDRLQRPEYITGTKSPVIVSEVLNNGGDDGVLPQGNMAGHAYSVSNGDYGSYYCQEHGLIIGICSVLPKTAYLNNIPKHFLKFTSPFQEFTPQLAHVGEQAIENQELFADHSDPTGTFGYTPRYAEYKTMPNRVCGDFATNLDYWTAVRTFAIEPDLNSDFITSNPTHDIFAVTDPSQDKLYCQVLHKIRAVRPMPKFGTPTF